MCTITYEQAQHRLRVTGECGPGDREAVERAFAALDDVEPVLIVDLVGVGAIDPAVAEVIVEACGRLPCNRITVLRRHGSEVDHVLRTLGA